MMRREPRGRSGAAGAGPLRSRVGIATATSAAGIALALCGCATLLPKLQPPQLTLNSIAFLSGSLQRQHFELSVHAVNPNPRPVEVSRIDVHLQLNGAAFADGTTQAAFALPPSGAADFPLEVTTSIVNAIPAVMAIQAHHSVEYRLYGEVKLQQSWLPALSFDQRGELQL
jgi:LEA14-like dessication related protein